MRLVVFDPVHLAQIDQEALQGHAVDPARALLTLMDGNTPVAIGGFVERSQDVAEVWVAMAPSCRARPVTMHRTALRVIGAAMLTYKTLRALSRKGQPQSQRWLDRLGFEPVDEDATFIHYQRVAPW